MFTREKVRKFVWFCIAIGVLTIVSAISVSHSKKTLHDNGDFTYGRIIDVGQRPKGGCWFDYVFEVDGKFYYGDGSSLRLRKSVAECLKDKHWNVPVLYDRRDPETSDMLVQLGDFEFYGVSIPDSMRSSLEFPCK